MNSPRAGPGPTRPPTGDGAPVSAGGPPGNGGAAPPHRSWRWLLVSPHRLAFFAGAVMLAATALWWLAVLWGRAWGVVPPWALPPATAHALLMAHGFMPLFFLGFACTGAPRWMGLDPIPAYRLLVPVCAIGLGWALVFIGAHLQVAVAGAGLAAVAAGQALALWRLAAWLRASRSRDRLHVRLMLAGQAAGMLALGAAAAAVLADRPHAVTPIVQASLWASHGVVFMTAAHRLVPYLAAGAWPTLQGRWPGALPLALAALMVSQAPWVGMPAAGAEALSAAGLVRAGFALAGTVAVAALAVHWAWVQKVRIRLLAMLYAGLLWLALALALQALATLGAGMPIAQGAALAALHALGMGFMGSVMLAMVTRVACGQHGRAVVVDRYVWALFGLAQVAVAARVLGAWLAPMQAALAAALLQLAMLAWAIVATGWALRYGRWFIGPRSDGRPG